MQDAKSIARIRRKYRALSVEMDERSRRQWAAAEARELGWGGVSAVAQATGLSRTTITAGLRELELPAKQRAVEGMRVRRPGGGRKALTEKDSGLLVALEALIEPVTRGDPESPLRWTCKSTRRLADELTLQRHPVSVNTVATLLRQAGYSLQANRKTREGASHPDRNAQFEHINTQVRRFQNRAQPAISVDTKKKELIGDFKNAGRLLITADGGGSNSPRSRLWKVSLQELADELGLRLHVCHFPPGTSKWNRIEHRLFSFITQNWRGKPLVSHQAVVSLIASTTTRTGLMVKAALDQNHYDTAVKVTDKQLEQLRLTPHSFHGDWNYMLTPRKRI